MALTPTQKKDIIRMKIELTSEIQELNNRAAKLNQLQNFIAILELPEPKDILGDSMIAADITKFYGRVKTKFNAEIPSVITPA